MQQIHQLIDYETRQVTGRGTVLVASLRANALRYEDLRVGDTILTQPPTQQYLLRGVEASRKGAGVGDMVGLLVAPA